MGWSKSLSKACWLILHFLIQNKKGLVFFCDIQFIKVYKLKTFV